MDLEMYFCQHCVKTGENLCDTADPLETERAKNYFRGYFSEDTNPNKCPYCGSKIIKINILTYDFYAIAEVSNYNSDFRDAMIELRQKDVIEYGLKMAEINRQLMLMDELEEKDDSNILKCPYCNSKDLVRISELGKALKVGFFGLRGADDLGKTWECQNCGSKF